jgi:hypothetical protein
MPKVTAGEGHVTSRDARGRFTSSGNPLGYRVHNAKSFQLQLEIAKELGGNLSAGDEIMLTRAVELLVSRPRSRNDGIRAINTAHRILRTLRAKYSKKDEVVPSLASYEASA